MADPLKDFRKKSRFIAEMRFEMVPSLIDTRGKLIELVHPQIKDRYFPIARLSQDQVLFSDHAEKPVNQFLVSVRQISVMLEDPATLQEFADTATKLLGLAFDHMGKGIPKVARSGVRFLEILAPARPTTYDDAVKNASKYIDLGLDLPLDITDSQAIVVHKNGRIGFGPTKKDDDWTKQVFQSPEKNVPEVGYAFDIDSYSLDVTTANRAGFIKAFQNVYELTLSTERALAARIGLLDGKA